MWRQGGPPQPTQSAFSTIYRYTFLARSKFYSWKYLSWLILLVAATNVICVGGKRRAFGIFVAALHGAYNETSMSELNWIGDSYASLGFFLMPFVTTAIIRFKRPYRFTMLLAGITIFLSCLTSSVVPNPGFLFLTHTVLHGVGSALVLCATSLITGDYFDKNHRFHVLATAFVSGGPYGVLIFGPLFSTWIHHHGWQNAFVYSAFLFLFVNLLGAITFLPRDVFEYNQMSGLTDEEATEDGRSYQDTGKSSAGQSVELEPRASGGRGWAFCSLDHINQNPQVIIWGVERLIHNVVIYGLLMNLTAYVTQALNDSLIKGAYVNLYFGLGESIVFTLGALTGDKIRGHLSFVYLVGACFAAVFLLILQRSYANIDVVYVLAGFTGAAVGVGNTFLYATAEEVMLVHGSIAFPMTKMIAGIGMLIAPIFSGLIIDHYGFRGFFVSMAICVCLRVILLSAIYLILRRKKHDAKKTAENVKRDESIVYSTKISKFPAEVITEEEVCNLEMHSNGYFGQMN